MVLAQRFADPWLKRIEDAGSRLVHYAPDHEVFEEWVYNAADIDGAKIVRARDIPGRDLKPLLDYYRDRSIWVVDADTLPPRLRPYSTDKTTQVSP
jgi:hypothetical protein